MTLTVTPPQPDYKKVWTLFRRPVTPGPEVVPRREVVFHGADPDTSYTVKVTLVLNGQAIAVSQELALLPHRKCIVTLIYLGSLLREPVKKKNSLKSLRLRKLLNQSVLTLS